MSYHADCLLRQIPMFSCVHACKRAGSKYILQPTHSVCEKLFVTAIQGTVSPADIFELSIG